MEIRCSCGCELDIQSVNFDCVYDMTVCVGVCDDCDTDACDRHDKQEYRANDLEDEVAALEEEVATLRVEIVDLEASIEETKDQMFQKVDR